MRRSGAPVGASSTARRTLATMGMERTPNLMDTERTSRTLTDTGRTSPMASDMGCLTGPGATMGTDMGRTSRMDIMGTVCTAHGASSGTIVSCLMSTCKKPRVGRCTPGAALFDQIGCPQGL
jgi:hypothetical protein